jgi:aminoacylase
LNIGKMNGAMTSAAAVAAAAVHNDKGEEKKLLTSLNAEEAQAAIQRFQAFLCFETVSVTAPASGAYKECANFLLQELNALQVLQDIHLLEEAPDHSPVVVAKWMGKDDTLPILWLNSHYDVVPADLSAWTVPPFEGLRKDNKIYGRGTQDMKCVCMQYVEAIRKIVQLHPDWQPSRSIYLTFVPDEEVGGGGMAAFLESAIYKSWSADGGGGVALALDEGLASTTNTFDIFYGERLPWWVDVTAKGPTGHGSRFIENTAVEQLIDLANKALLFRQGQKEELHGSSEKSKHENCAHAVARKKATTLGDVTSLNITTLQAGVRVGNTFAYNCVPPTAKCSLDIRISPHMPPSEMKALLDQWCRECSKGASSNGDQPLSWEYIGGHGDLQTHATTSTDRTANPWYAIFCDSLLEMGLTGEPSIFPAATDSRFLRALGIRALGFSPMRNTEIMLHENDEYIPESTFLEGIGVYVGLIQALASPGEEIERQLTKDESQTTDGGES